jgi:methyl-accepting chemotaxis protein
MKSIKSKMILIFTLLITISVGAVGVGATLIGTHQVKEDAEKSITSLAVEISKQISANMETNMVYIETLASLDILTDETPWEEKVAYFEKEAKRTGYNSFGFVDLDGNSTMLDASARRDNLRDLPEFKEVLKGKNIVSDIFIHPVTQEILVTFIVPVKREGQVIGALLGHRDGTILSQIIKEVEYGETGRGFIINREGTFQGHPEEILIQYQINLLDTLAAYEDGSLQEIETEDEEGQNTDINQLAELFRDRIQYGETGSGEHTFDGVPILVGFTPVEGTNWMVVFEVDEYEILAGIDILRNGIIVGTLLWIIIGIVCTYLVSLSISKPLVVVTKSIEQLSNYDLTADEKEDIQKYVVRKDEIGKISNALIKMRDNFIDILKSTGEVSKKVKDSANELKLSSQGSASTSQEIAKTIEEMARGASDQALDTEKGAVAMEEMSKVLIEDKNYIQQLNNSADEVVRLKDEGMETVQKLVQKTEESNQASARIYEVVVDTDESAKKIESASQMIRSIADQTNLLALNAAIEAARAGEAGKGFAVVADEIRKLAEQSSQFTEEIRSVVEELSLKTKNAVEIMDRVKTDIVEVQSASVLETEGKFRGITKAVELTKDVIDKINISSQNLEDKKNEMMMVIENLSAISEENAASTQEASASVEEQTAGIEEVANSTEVLAELADGLNQLVMKFKM